MSTDESATPEQAAPDQDAPEATSADAAASTADAGVPAALPGAEKLTLEIEMEKPSTCERHIRVTVARDDIDRYFGKSVDEILPEAQVPGFRPGKAPRKLVENRFRPQLLEQVKGTLIMDVLAQVSEEQKLSPISEPDFDFEAVEIPEEGPMVFEFDLEVRPEFDLPQWRGLKLEKPVREFTDEDVEQRMRELLEEYGAFVPLDEPARLGDLLTIELTFLDGADVVSSVDELELRIRPTLSFRDAELPEFDKLMIGVRPDDVRETQIVVSDEADAEEYRGKTLKARFKVLEVKKLELPTLTADILSELGDFENEEDLRGAVRQSLQRQLVYHQQRRMREQITEKLTAEADWALPPDLLRRQARRELERAVLELRSAGFPEDAIRAHENELRRNSMASTQRALKEHFILERVAEEEKIEATESDYAAEVAQIAIQQGESPRRVRARLEKRGAMDALHNQVVERKVLERISAEADYTEVPFDLPVKTEVEPISVHVAGQPTEIPEAKYDSGERPQEKLPGQRG